VLFVRDALSLVHDIGTFLNASALRRSCFSEVQGGMTENRRFAEEESIEVEIFVENDEESDEGTKDKKMSASGSSTCTGVKKLCATTWLARTPALQDVLRAYDALQICFEDFAQTSGACHAKANGIAVVLGKSLSYLGI